MNLDWFSILDLISVALLVVISMVVTVSKDFLNDTYRNLAQAQSDASRSLIILHRIEQNDLTDDNLFVDVMPFIRNFGDESRCWDAVTNYELEAELIIARACIIHGLVPTLPDFDYLVEGYERGEPT